MAKLDYKKIFIKDACPTKIGGQAIMEGVMMQSEDRQAIAMRLPSKELYLKVSEKPKAKGISKVPIIRGCVNFFSSLISGTDTLMQSADILEKFAPEEYSEEPGKFEKWINKKFGDRAAWNFMMIASVIIALIISIAVFVILPTIIVNWLKHLTSNAFVLNLIEGILRMLMFVLYILAISKMPDVKTLFQYHGSEHKTIHCFENNLELTPENAQQFLTLHPRCGTSFLMFVFLIALLIFSFLGWPNLPMRILSRLLLLPVIAGISYELLKWAGRSDGAIVRILSYPGLMLQKITTAEPTLEQLEVAILSLKAVLPGSSIELGEGFVDKDGNRLDDFREEDFLKSRSVELDRDDFMFYTDPGEESNGKRDSLSDIDKTSEKNSTVKGKSNKKTLEFEKFEFDEKDYKPVKIEKELGRTYATIESTETVEGTLRWGEQALRAIENGRNEANMMLCYAVRMNQSQLITHAHEKMKREDFETYKKIIQERLRGKPMQYIVGSQEFMGNLFRVNENVLIPRLDTEVLVEKCIEILKKQNLENPKVLDMCTGSGAIGISLAVAIKNAIVTLTDYSEAALRLAMSNANLNRVANRCSFEVGNMFEALISGRKYDMIVCNPPYIESDVINKLSIEVREYEPREALDGGSDGLDFYRIIAREADLFLQDGGILALEIGDNQAHSVVKLLQKTTRYSEIKVYKDLAGKDRVVIAKKK